MSNSSWDIETKMIQSYIYYIVNNNYWKKNLPDCNIDFCEDENVGEDFIGYIFRCVLMS